MHVNEHGKSFSSKRERHFWVVSPNVGNNKKTVAHWRNATLTERAAFMGYDPDDPGHGQSGPKFAGRTQRGVVEGDVILIARRYLGNPEIVAFGVVRGKHATKIAGFKPPDAFGSLRMLSSFRPWSRPPS